MQNEDFICPTLRSKSWVEARGQMYRISVHFHLITHIDLQFHLSFDFICLKLSLCFNAINVMIENNMSCGIRFPTIWYV